MRYLTALYFGLLCTPAFSAAQGVGRRGFISSLVGVFGSVTGRGTNVSTVPLETPVVIQRSSVALNRYRYRADRIVEMNQPIHGGFDWSVEPTPLTKLAGFPFGPEAMDVIEDWCRSHPGAGDVVRSQLRELIELCSDLSGIKNVAAINAHVAKRSSMEQEIRAAVDEWPWSTLNWGQVFGKRLAQVESDLAVTLGADVDVAKVYELTDHVMIRYPHRINKLSLIGTLGSENYDSSSPALYSAENVERLARAIEVFSPLAARVVRRHEEVDHFDVYGLRYDLTKNGTRLFQYAEGSYPLRFSFVGYELSHLGPLDPEVMTAKYAKGIDALRSARARVRYAGTIALERVCPGNTQGHPTHLRHRAQRTSRTLGRVQLPARGASWFSIGGLDARNLGPDELGRRADEPSRAAGVGANPK